MIVILTMLEHLALAIAVFLAFVGVGVLLSGSHSGEGWN